MNDVVLKDLFPLSQNLPEDVKHYVRASKAENTKKVYRNSLKHFYQWGGEIPATPEMVAAYLSAHAPHYAMATLETRLAALSQAHKIGGFANPVDNELVKITFEGICREHGVAQKKPRAAVIEVILKIVENLDQKIATGSLKAQRDKALVLLMFTAALRRSEVAALDVSDLESVEQGLIVRIKQSKGDQKQLGEYVPIPFARQHLTACPILAISQWRLQAGVENGPLFRSVNRHGKPAQRRIGESSINTIIKQLIQAAGIPDAEKYSSHSLRAGLTTSSILEGKSPLPLVSKHLRHKDVKTTMEYFEVTDLFANNVASLL